MKSLVLVLAVATMMVMTTGCAPYSGSREAGGTLLGAGTGALLGSQLGHGRGHLLGMAVGTLAGAMVGQEIGRSLDRADQLAMDQTARKALEETPTRQSSTWVNPDTGHSGSFTPIRDTRSASGQYCREYQQTVIVAGSRQQAFGTACRQPDGSWQIVNSKG